MAKFNERWTVGPHGPVETVDELLLTVTGEIVMPLGYFPRRMTAVGLAGRRSAIWSAVPLREPEMHLIEALGPPAFLIVPGIAHRLDLKPWKTRYPDARVICPPGAVEAVSEILPPDGTLDLLEDPGVRLETVPGTGGREAAMLVKRGDATTLIVNDILANVRHPRGLGANIMARLFGFGVKRPRMPRIGKRLFVDDAPALSAAFRAWAREPGLVRIIVSHGDVITDDCAGVLEQAAKDLVG